MRIVFTKSNLIGSKLIRWGLNEPTSHVAFVFDEKLVIHSSLNGVELAWFNTFCKKNDIVFHLKYDLPLEQEEEIYQSILNNYDSSGYDYKAYFYFAWCILKMKLFKTPLPKSNAWGSKGSFLCTEMITTLPFWLLKVDSKDYGIVSPYALYQELLKKHPISLIKTEII